MTAETKKKPRRPCPACSRTFPNGKALRQHLWQAGENGDEAHLAHRPRSSAPAKERRPSTRAPAKRVFDLT